jgi:L-threonylcarbamoyladenylate synthase
VPIAVTQDVDAAVQSLRRGGLVALPTETVYGLAGDARNAEAVHRIFAAKGRPATHPVIVHLPGPEVLDDWATDVPPWARDLAATVWPGPLTLVVPRGEGVLDAVTGGQPTVGLRVPAHPLTLAVLRTFGGGLAAPSANRYGQVSPTTAQHVVDELGPLLDADRDLVLDGGRCPVGVESTIIGAWDEHPRLLRSGAVTVGQVEQLTGLVVVRDAAGVRAPGSTESHYAPRARVLVTEPEDLAALSATLAPVRFGLIALADLADPGVPHERLAAPTDDTEYAHLLYAALRAADEAGLDTVVAVLPPDEGVGHAVRDRLRRAASARTVAP